MAEPVAILGGGVMGETLLSGLLRGGRTAGRRRASASAGPSGPRSSPTATACSRAQRGRRRRRRDTVVLRASSRRTSRRCSPRSRGTCGPGTLVVSLAAGITTAFVEERLPDGHAGGAGHAEHPGAGRRGRWRRSAPGDALRRGAPGRAPRRCCGRAARSSGCPSTTRTPSPRSAAPGPAYIFYVVEAMIEAGVLLGLPRATSHRARRPDRCTARRRCCRRPGEHPTVLREQVSSPAGTTMAALRQLDDHKVRAAFLTAMEAARDRSRELSSGRLTGPRGAVASPGPPAPDRYGDVMEALRLLDDGYLRVRLRAHPPDGADPPRTRPARLMRDLGLLAAPGRRRRAAGSGRRRAAAPPCTRPPSSTPSRRRPAPAPGPTCPRPRHRGRAGLRGQQYVI